MISAHQLMNSTVPSTEWVVHEVLPVGLTILSAVEKSGKSWLCLQLSKSVAGGMPFLEYQTYQGKVLYMALEDSISRIKDRCAKQCWTGAEQIDLIGISDAQRITGLLQGNLTSFEQGIKSAGYQLVIIDTLSAAYEGSQVSHSAISSLFKGLREMAQRLGCAVLVVDHWNKQGKTFGSIAKLTLADTIWELERQEGSTSGCIRVKGKDVQNLSLNVEFDGSRWMLNRGVFTENLPKSGSIKALNGLKVQYDNAMVELSGPSGKDMHFSVRIVREVKGWRGSKVEEYTCNVPLSMLIELSMRRGKVRKVK